MSAPDAISLHNVGKRYRRPATGTRSTTLKGFVVRDVWAALGARMGRQRRPQAPAAPGGPGALWALRNVSFTVRPGEVVGVVGPNGAGKSTLLKLLGNIVRPDEGDLRVRGRIAALIELGAGFHPELTGRENVLINGVILGLTRAQVRERMQAIVDFAQVGEFIDYPVRTYSSGMYARLGFAVAIHVDPDVLLVDEVLSVGDAIFTRKCRAALDAFRARGKSIVVVSHDLNTIATWCDRALWIEGGTLRGEGAAAELVAEYTARLERTT